MPATQSLEQFRPPRVHHNSPVFCRRFSTHERQNNTGGADKTELLGSYGKNRIPYRLRQIVKLLNALTKSPAGYATRTDSDERLLDLITACQRILSRVKKCFKTTHNIRSFHR